MYTVWDEDWNGDNLVLPGPLNHSANPAEKRSTDMSDAMGRTFKIVADMIEAYLISEEDPATYVTPADLKTELDDILEDEEFDQMHDQIVSILEELKDFLRDRGDKPIRGDITDAAFYVSRNGENKVRKVRVWRKYREYEGEELVIKAEGAKEFSLMPILNDGFRLEFDALGSPNQKHTLKGD